MKLLWLVVGGLAVYVLLFICLSALLRERRQVENRISKLIDEKNDTHDEFAEKSALVRLVQPMIQNLSVVVGRFLPITDASRKRIKKDLNRARVKMNVTEYFTAMFLCAGLFFVLIILVQPRGTGIFYGIVCALLGAEMFRFLIQKRGTRNHKQMMREFPDVLDLLSISIGAGASFEQAMSHVVANSSGLLVEEIAVVLQEAGMGLSRHEALKNMADRVEFDSFSMFVTAVNQAEEMGMSLTTIMKTQADAARDELMQSVRTESMKLPVKILFPMIIFIFPAIFVILLGPAVMNIAAAF